MLLICRGCNYPLHERKTMSEHTLIRSGIGNKASLYNILRCMMGKDCKAYYELFAGALGVFFSLYNGMYEKEYINDISIDLAALYYALANNMTRDRTVDGILSIEKPDNRQEAKKQFNVVSDRLRGKGPLELEQIPEDEIVDMAINTYLAYSQSMNCSSKGYSSLKSNEQYHCETRENIKNAMERLITNPVVTCRDGLEILRDGNIAGNPYNQLVLDPPYCGLYRNCRTDYRTDMPGLESHIRLAESIKDAKAAVVLCGYREQNTDIPTVYDAVLGEQYKCYKISEQSVSCEVVSKGMRKRKAIEYVWTNREPSKMAKYYVSLRDCREYISLEDYWSRINILINAGCIPDRQVAEYQKAYQAFYQQSLHKD